MPIPLPKSQGHVGVINKYKFRRNLKTKQNKRFSYIYVSIYSQPNEEAGINMQ